VFWSLCGIGASKTPFSAYPARVERHRGRRAQSIGEGHKRGYASLKSHVRHVNCSLPPDAIALRSRNRTRDPERVTIPLSPAAATLPRSRTSGFGTRGVYAVAVHRIALHTEDYIPQPLIAPSRRLKPAKAVCYPFSPFLPLSSPSKTPSWSRSIPIRTPDPIGVQVNVICL
jgi:hypothetical protein